MTSNTYKTTRVADGFSFIEGPRWRDGRLYVSDIFNKKVLTISDSGKVSEICTLPNFPSGLGFAPDGSLLISCRRPIAGCCAGPARCSRNGRT